VDGHDITQQDWDNAHRAESDRLRAQNPTMDAKLLDSPEARYATLEKLVRDRVLAAAAAKMHLTTPDAQLVRTLREIPAIASLQKPDGSLDAEAYKALVGSQGMTPEGFEANLRRELASIRYWVPSLRPASRLLHSCSRPWMLCISAEIQVARFDASAFAGKVQPTEGRAQGFL
jgi:peptidyl-prolyl cis-trans isomerase D